MPESSNAHAQDRRQGAGADSRLYNADLAPLSDEQRSWGSVAIFNVWSNTAQSVLGYTLAASLFLNYGLNGWAVFAAIVLAGFIIMFLVNLVGKPSVQYGIPYPVMARAGMGVFGANFPALLRGTVAIFWYGAQSYVAAGAIALLIRSVLDTGSGETLLGLDAVGWISLVLVSVFQVGLFWRGIGAIRIFLNWAAPAVYAVMIILMFMLWHRAGPDFLPKVAAILQGKASATGNTVAGFFAVMGAMIAFYSPIIVNYGDFARYVGSVKAMRKGNLLGLPVNIAFFALIALMVTAGSEVVLGQKLTNPTEIVARLDSLSLTVVAALVFFIATVGINVVANFVPPANDLANLMPSRISFRTGGLITAGAAFVVSALWVSVISQFGIVRFANTLGALLAPAYGVMIVDYYLVRKQHLDLNALYSADPNGAYYYRSGWNWRALAAFLVSAIFSLAGVWLPALHFLSGFDWIIGAFLAGSLYYCISPRFKPDVTG